MRGMTLVETLVYIALIGIVLTGFIALIMNISGIRTKQLVQGQVNSNIEQLQMILAEQIKTADLVIHPMPGTASTSLRLESAGGEETLFEVINSRLVAKTDNGAIDNLSDASISISNLSVTNAGTSGVDDSFRITATVSYQTSPAMEFNFSAPLLVVASKQP